MAARAIACAQSAGPTEQRAVGETLIWIGYASGGGVGDLTVSVALDYASRRLLFLCVLKERSSCFSVLMRHIDVSVEVDFMAFASYASITDSSDVVRILKDLDMPTEGRPVLMVEDILDSGLALQYLMRNLCSRNPRYIATLEL